MGCHGCPVRLDVIRHTLTNILTALKRDHHNDKPRPPPPAATPVDFPCCEPKSTNPANRVPQDLFNLFSQIQKGPSRDHLNALNASLNSNVPLEELVPAEHLPPKSWLQAPTQTEDPTNQSILINGGSLPAHETFHVRAKDLQISNEDGYRTIHRVPFASKDGPIRLLFFRKFWEELDCMADYWDATQDKYTKPRSPSQKGSDNAAMDADELRKLVQNGDNLTEQDGQPTGDVEMQDVSTSQTSSSKLSKDAPTAPIQNDTSTSDPSSTQNGNSSSSTATPLTDTDTAEDLYTGRRTSTGSLAPQAHLEKCTFTFIETLALPFRLRFAEPKSQPKLQLGGRLLLPLPHMASVHRMPLDQAEARRGVQEGPVMGVVAAEFAKWRLDGQEPGEGSLEVLHLLKEVGCVLLLAQRRAREGKEEDVSGKVRWWAETPRWGGGSGVAVFKEPTAEGEGGDKATGKGTPSLIEAQRRRVKRARRGQEEQKKGNALVPPSSLWERGVRYARIGMERGGGCGIDDIYLVSSVNHHFSIIHARVHTKYIEYITSGGDAAEQREEWYQLSMQRSKWYDLLDASDRIEAMMGVWAVMSWMMRDNEG